LKLQQREDEVHEKERTIKEQ